jgi:hypothetical protein
VQTNTDLLSLNKNETNPIFINFYEFKSSGDHNKVCVFRTDLKQLKYSSTVLLPLALKEGQSELIL